MTKKCIEYNIFFYYFPTKELESLLIFKIFFLNLLQGLDTQYYQEGVRPNLAVFYQSIRSRPSFEHILKWREHERYAVLFL